MMKRLFALVTLFLAQLHAEAQPPQERAHSLPGRSFTINFDVNKSDIDDSFLDNASELQAMAGYLNTEKRADIDFITLLTTASPDGREAFNSSLAKERAESLRKYIAEHFPFIPSASIYTKEEVENWDAVRTLVEADAGLPNRAAVLRILGSGASVNTIQSRIKAIDNGRTFEYIDTNMLRRLRQGVVAVYIHERREEPAPKPEPKPVLPPVKPQPRPQPPVEQPVAPPPPVEEPPAVEEEMCGLHIKTNAALLLAGIFNAGVEFCLGNRYTLDIPVAYSPYAFNCKYFMRTLAFQPELRYWLGKNNMRGHFIGLHTGLAWYNFSVNTDYRYQDKDGRTPLWNIGLSYGYAMRLSRKFSLELTLGAGYYDTTYDRFYNIPNGALYDTHSKNGFGITRAGINLSYKWR